MEPWKAQKLSYNQWIQRGSLFKFLDTFFRENQGLTVLELGSGNSTRILAKYCSQVVSVDVNKQSAYVPTTEQRQGVETVIKNLELEDNVIFVVGDIRQMDLNEIVQHRYDVIFFDIGELDEKSLYEKAYERLKSEGILLADQILLVDNAPRAQHFIKQLQSDGYIIEDFVGQCIARPPVKGT